MSRTAGEARINEINILQKRLHARVCESNKSIVGDYLEGHKSGIRFAIMVLGNRKKEIRAGKT